MPSSPEKRIRKSSKAHQRYYVDGKLVPSVTGITGVMNKPALIKWANNLGLDGIDNEDYVDKLASAGTLAHRMVEDFYRKMKTFTGAFSKDAIDAAQISYDKFLEWQKTNMFIPMKIELQLVSREYKFGGTLDLYGMLGGLRTLLDIKTSKAVYKDYFTQVGGGYRILLEENGYPVDEVQILRLGRNESEGFQCITLAANEMELHKERFLVCRKLYELNTQIGR